MVGEWPMVGRHEQLATIDALRSDGNHRGALIFGPAGVGKSRLAAEVLDSAARDGLRIGRAAASAAARATPLGALAHLLPPDAASARTDPVTLYARVADALAADDDRPFLLLVDDVPLLDATSSTLIGQLLDAGDVFFVGTVRSGEGAHGTVDHFTRRGDLLRLDLDRLSHSDVDALLHLALGGPVGAATLASFWSVSQGTPLVVRELLVGAQAAGNLVEHHGGWHLVGSLPTTQKLTEIVDVRLASVSDAARHALETVSLTEPIGLDDLEALAERSAVDELDSAGLLALRRDRRRTQVANVHPLYGEVLRDALSPLSRRRRLLAYADRIEAHGARRRQDPLDIAAARLDADGSADPNLLLAAARLARYAHDFGEVERLARAALAERSDGVMAEASLLLAEALHELGSFAEADQVLREATEWPVSDERVRVQLAAMHVRNLVWGLQRPDEALAVNHLAQERTVDEDSLDELRTDEALVRLFSGRPFDALRVIVDVTSDRPRTRCLRAITEVPALILTGRCETALGRARQAFEERTALGDQVAIAPAGVHFLYQAHAFTEAGRLAEAIELTTAARAAAGEGGPPDAQMWFVFNLGRAMLLTGRIRTARRWFMEATAASHAAGMEAPRRMVLSLLATSLTWLGDAQGAGRVVEEMETLPAFDYLGPEQTLGRAWAVAADQPRRAREMLQHAACDAADKGHHASEAWLLHDVARLGDPAAVTERLDELCTFSEGALVPAYALHCRSAAAADADGLSEAVQRFEAMGALLLAAEAATAAARVHQRKQAPREAAAQQSRASALARRCEGAHTPGLAAVEATVPLTRREREIADLAADRLSSREIGERLYLSVRTVNNHLQNVYSKLGVTSRSELGTALGRQVDDQRG